MQNMVDIEYDFIKIDDDRYKSVLFVVDGNEVWLPRSQIEIDVGDKIVTMPEWLGVEKELV